MEEILTYERDLFFWLNGTHTAFLDTVMWSFKGVYIWLPAFFVPVYFFFRRRRECLPATLAICLMFALACIIPAYFFKPVFARFRPTNHPLFMDYITLLNGYKAGGLYGFISGHATNAFGYATLSSLLVKNRIYTLAIFLWAILMAYSRVYMGAHFLSDVVAGLFVGILLGWAIYALYRHWISRHTTNHCIS